VSITQPGSYVLTSDLVLPVATSGITILADDVHIDLNEFTIRGPAVCVQGACAQSASPRLVGVGRPTFGTGQGKRCSVRNGAVIGIDGNGVALTNASEVSHVQVASVTLIGIEMSGTNALVERSTIDSVGSAGILIAGGIPGHPAVVRDNVLTNTALAISSPAISGARSGGTGNSCDDGSCSEFRRFYLTKGASDGAHALAACAAGFHMASLWEIFDPTQLTYDVNLGEGAFSPSSDVGLGPTTGTGWVRTGSTTSGGGIRVGQYSCSAWTDQSAANQGTSAGLTSNWDTPGATWPWNFIAFPCADPHAVWCVED
jgi:hypothetical protein